MKFKFTNRQTLSASVIFFYLIPLFFVFAYTLIFMPRNISWVALSLSLLVLACGSLLFMILLYQWEKSFKKQADYNEFYSASKAPPFTKNDEKDSQELTELRTNIHEYQEKQMNLENENQQLIVKANQIAQELADYKIFTDEQIKQKNLQIHTFQRNLEDQQNEFKQQQDSMEQLHTKVRDLSYEIKTLLSINEREQHFLAPVATTHSDEIDTEQINFPTEKQVHNEIDASLLLKRCINTAQKLTGAYYYGNDLSRYREFSAPHSAIDLRRLFDSLRMENEALIIVYSPKEHKLLFANGQARSMLGWSPEKFVSDFYNLIQDGAQEWKRSMNQVTTQSETQLKMMIKAKSGQDIYLSCHLGFIPTGLFRSYVIGVFYTQAKETSLT